MNKSEMQKPMMENETRISIKVEEYERLKRLDENLRKYIKERIEALSKPDVFIPFIKAEIKELESLYE